MKRFFLLTILLPLEVLALDLKGHQFTDSYRYSLLEDNYTERFAGKNVFLGSYAYVHAPFYYTNKKVSNINEEIIGYNHVLTLGYSRYVTEKLVLGLDIVGVHNEVLGDSYTGFGDVNLRGKYLLTDRQKDWGISLNPFVTLPTGREKNFTTGGSLGAGVRGVYEKHLSEWHLLASLGYSYTGDNKYQEADHRSLLLTQLGLSYDVTSVWNVNGEVLRNFTLHSDYRQDEGDYFITVKNKTTDSLSLYGGAGVAGVEKVDRNNYTLFAGFKWSEPPAPVVAPAPKKIAPRPKPATREQETKYGAVIDIDNIYFANNSSSVAPAEEEKVMKVVAAYKKLGDKFSMVVIEGFASKRGNSAQNKILAQKRTDSVLEILRANGVPIDRMATVSYGDQMAQDPEEWKNRKVQFRVYQD